MSSVFGDIETDSTRELKACGAFIYASDPSTDVLCLCYAVGDGEILVWKPGDPVPKPFANPHFSFVWDNWTFDLQIYARILVPRYGFAPITIERQDCAQRLALANGYPAELGLRCEALGLPYRKDPEARKAMLRLSRRKPYADPAKRAHDLALLIARCTRDVESTRASYTHPAMKPLPPEERRLLLLDAKINARGIRANIPFLKAGPRARRQAAREHQCAARRDDGRRRHIGISTRPDHGGGQRPWPQHGRTHQALGLSHIGSRA